MLQFEAKAHECLCSLKPQSCLKTNQCWTELNLVHCFSCTLIFVLHQFPVAERVGTWGVLNYPMYLILGEVIFKKFLLCLIISEVSNTVESLYISLLELHCWINNTNSPQNGMMMHVNKNIPELFKNPVQPTFNEIQCNNYHGDNTQRRIQLRAPFLYVSYFINIIIILTFANYNRQHYTATPSSQYRNTRWGTSLRAENPRKANGVTILTIVKFVDDTTAVEFFSGGR